MSLPPAQQWASEGTLCQSSALPLGWSDGGAGGIPFPFRVASAGGAPAPGGHLAGFQMREQSGWSEREAEEVQSCVPWEVGEG